MFIIVLLEKAVEAAFFSLVSSICNCILHLIVTDLILMTSKVYLIEDKAQKKQLSIRQFEVLANRQTD